MRDVDILRRTYWYHEECLARLGTAVRTSASPHHEICAHCGYEGTCVQAELVTNPDVRKIEDSKLGAENWTAPTGGVAETMEVLGVAPQALTAVSGTETEKAESIPEVETVEEVTEDVQPPEEAKEEEAPKTEIDEEIAELEAKLAALKEKTG